ncbi:YceI family protein [Cesiribacter sp. SM1]|uniref:YceI family protein n=1 Tax=Cesiribacter sp. SM1 TaxID=2861196 RepID=UPI001CD2EB5D|nr:YceI family protein [Cesiribacter sp. SM1]
MKKAFIALLITGSLLVAGFHKEVKQFSYRIDADSSVVEWRGASPKTAHNGSFAVNSPGLEVVNGQVTGGTFIIPIASIRNYDLPKLTKPLLIKHLKSEDFFNMALYPEASFTITKVEPLSHLAAGTVAGANTVVSGNFTMIGNTHPISFPAKINFIDNRLDVEASFTIDRTKWGMLHASDPALKNRHIYPEVDIHLKVLAFKQQAN